MSDIVQNLRKCDIAIKPLKKEGLSFPVVKHSLKESAPPKCDLAIRPLKKEGLSFPVIKRSLKGSDPPEEGKGLRLAVYQGSGLCGDRNAIEHNLQNLRTWAESAAAEKAQLLVVAELFLCGYNVRPEDRDEAAVKIEEVLRMVTPIARKNKIALVVPYAERVEGDDKMFDSMVLIDKDGNLIRNYRKTQLWGSDEKTVWRYPYVKDPEEAYTVDKVNGIGVGLLNCYEAEFPELNRILALKGAQVILIPTAADVGTFDSEKKEWTNWAYPDVSRTIIPANAYHNRVFCSYINHSLFQFRSDGTTLSGIYLGNSTVADPLGQTVSDDPSSGAATVTRQTNVSLFLVLSCA